MGITIPAGSNIVLAMHYPHGSAGEVDQTKIRLYFYEEETEIREVLTYPILSNWNFWIPANSQEEVMAQAGPFNQDLSVLSVFPHMHLVGEYIQSYAVSPENEVIPFVRIPHWDFEWQEFFFFEQIQHVPAGSTFFANGTYNNTADNPHNPNDPPQLITAGLNTSDEMFLVYFHYLEYEEGDEDIDLTELTSLPSSLTEVELEEGSVLSVFPNPAVNEVHLNLNIEQAQEGSIFIYDVTGKIMDRTVFDETLTAGQHDFKIDVAEWNSGVYYYSAVLNGTPYAGKFVVE